MVANVYTFAKYIFLAIDAQNVPSTHLYTHSDVPRLWTLEIPLGFQLGEGFVHQETPPKLASLGLAFLLSRLEGRATPIRNVWGLHSSILNQHS